MVGAQVTIPQATSTSWLPPPMTAHVSQRSPVRAEVSSQGKDIHPSVTEAQTGAGFGCLQVSAALRASRQPASRGPGELRASPALPRTRSVPLAKSLLLSWGPERRCIQPRVFQLCPGKSQASVSLPLPLSAFLSYILGFWTR